MVKKWEITIPELTGDEVRHAYIYLPTSYRYAADKRYPVLYMFDGHNVFFDADATYGKSWGMKDYLDYTDTELIVAAVECNHHPDNGRLSEYSPYDFVMHGDPIQGRGQITMDWFVREFKPYIDQHYRTLPERRYTMIAGSSMGGLMSLYAVLAYNDIFSKAAALSPSLWTAPKDIREMIRTSDLTSDTVLYMDYGSEEMRSRKSMAHEYGRMTSLLMDKHIMLTSRIIPNGTHCEASWERQIPFFLSTLLYDLS